MIETQFLTSIFIEKNFQLEDLEKILSQYEKIEFTKNDYFIKEGTTANFYYF